jgi:hypothetical protein
MLMGRNDKCPASAEHLFVGTFLPSSLPRLPASDFPCPAFAEHLLVGTRFLSTFLASQFPRFLPDSAVRYSGPPRAMGSRRKARSIGLTPETKNARLSLSIFLQKLFYFSCLRPFGTLAGRPASSLPTSQFLTGLELVVSIKRKMPSFRKAFSYWYSFTYTVSSLPRFKVSLRDRRDSPPAWPTPVGRAGNPRPPVRPELRTG